MRARVVAITDGDTIRVLRGETQIRVRLHGVDAPEKGQPFAAAAKRIVSDLVFNEDVTLRVRDIDRYGRTVAEVVLADGITSWCARGSRG